jgi:hypothetical protein
MMRRDCGLALGGYDPDIRYYEDVDFHMRGIRRSGHVFVDCRVLHYRTGARSLIHNLKGDQAAVHSSNTIIYRKYQDTFGLAHHRALQVASKVLPLRMPKLRDSAT